MEPKHLMQLAAILEKGSITAAAEHLLLTQPTLTRNMHTLEMQAGGLLFSRSRFGVRSTTLGENLARQGRTIARQIQVAEGSISRHKLGFHNQLRVGVGPLIGMGMIPPLYEKFSQEHPDVALTIYCDRPIPLFEQMIDGEHDIVISASTNAHIPKGFHRSLLFEDQLSVFCGKSHPLAKQKTFQPHELEACEWMVVGFTSPLPFHNMELDFLKQIGVNRVSTQFATVNDAVILSTVLMQGRHLAVLPRTTTRLTQETYSLVELPMAAEAPTRSLYFWCREEIKEDAAVRTFENLAKDILANVS